MKVKEESEKGDLKLNYPKMKIMASSPITSWEINGGNVETVTDFIFLGSNTVDSDCSHKIKRCLLLGRKDMTNLDSVLKSRGITLLFVFPVVMYRYESWNIKKDESWRIDAFKMWCCKRLLWVLWSARISNQSIWKEINPEYSLERKLQFSGHRIPSANSLEKTLMLGKIEGRRRRGQ